MVCCGCHIACWLDQRMLSKVSKQLLVSGRLLDVLSPPLSLSEELFAALLPAACVLFRFAGPCYMLVWSV